ncbi:MAG: methionyl-tRNA formyltransferase [Erysipelotrichia bacterium]|nr:methionyl-tRNA formyltransferase [Erysipelotrichia bacterium]
MKKTKIVFMGTPIFGREILRCLTENGYDVVAAVCQPDKAVGRKQVITYCPVKQYAIEKNIDVIQPIKIKNEYQTILDYHPDLIITCAYGQIIPTALLDNVHCINVHASLLPKLRGGAPIQHSIIDGYDKTGITIMEMAKKMDSGDIISQCEVAIDIRDTYKSLHDKLIAAAVELLLKTLPNIIERNYVAVKQNEEEVTFGYNISKEEEHLNLSKNYRQVYDQIRGLSDNPGCYGLIDNKKIKLYQVEMTDDTCQAVNGTIVFKGKEFGIIVDNRLLLIKQLQMEGKSVMSSKDFRNGTGRNWEGKVMC